MLFILDESSSIWAPDFQKQLEFIQDVIKQFDIGPTMTRVGVITFGTYAQLRIGLGQHVSRHDLLHAVRSLGQSGGGTSTNMALQLARQLLQYQGRLNVPRIVILVTDGRADDPTSTQEEATLFAKDEAQILAVGVGASANINALQDLTKNSDSVYPVDSFDALSSLKHVLAYKACHG